LIDRQGRTCALTTTRGFMQRLVVATGASNVKSKAHHGYALAVSLRPAPDEWRPHRCATIRKRYRAKSDTVEARAQKPDWKGKNATRRIHPSSRDSARSKTQSPPPK